MWLGMLEISIPYHCKIETIIIIMVSRLHIPV